jgi:hypothetical protein
LCGDHVVRITLFDFIVNWIFIIYKLFVFNDLWPRARLGGVSA